MLSGFVNFHLVNLTAQDRAPIAEIHREDQLDVVSLETEMEIEVPGKGESEFGSVFGFEG